MQFEGKHGPLEPQTHVVSILINISKTALAAKNQVQNMFPWNEVTPEE